jgi:hypothetical protein
MATVSQFKQSVAFWYPKYMSNIANAVKNTNTMFKIPANRSIRLELILAIIKVESAGYSYASRYEPGFHKWLQGKLVGRNIQPRVGFITRETEMFNRATSFGLMQILGQTAREMDYNRTYLAELFDIDVNLFWGCKYLATRMIKYPAVTDYIAAYNSGTPKYKSGRLINEAYVKSVLNYRNSFRQII